MEARISENAPRGAREREFSSALPPSGSKSKARPGTPISVHLANLPSTPVGQQQQEAPHGECSVGTSKKIVTDLNPHSPVLLQRGTTAMALRHTSLDPPRDRLLRRCSELPKKRHRPGPLFSRGSGEGDPCMALKHASFDPLRDRFCAVPPAAKQLQSVTQ